MIIGLDGCVFDWLLVSPRAPEFLDKMRHGVFSVKLTGDVVAEVFHTPDLERRHRLMAVLFSNFRDFVPTQALVIQRDQRRPRRLVRIFGTPRAMELQRALGATGVSKLEAVHLIDAHLAGCSAFVTLDKKDLLRLHRRAKVKRIMPIDVLSPEELLDRLSDATVENKPN